MNHTMCEHCKEKVSMPDWILRGRGLLPLYKGNRLLWLCDVCYQLLEDYPGITLGYDQ